MLLALLGAALCFAGMSEARQERIGNDPEVRSLMFERCDLVNEHEDRVDRYNYITEELPADIADLEVKAQVVDAIILSYKSRQPYREDGTWVSYQVASSLRRGDHLKFDGENDDAELVALYLISLKFSGDMTELLMKRRDALSSDEPTALYETIKKDLFAIDELEEELAGRHADFLFTPYDENPRTAIRECTNYILR